MTALIAVRKTFAETSSTSNQDSKIQTLENGSYKMVHYR